MNPFDLRGPEFLQLYLLVLAVAIAAAVVVRRLLRRSHAGVSEETAELDFLPIRPRLWSVIYHLQVE